VGTLGATAVSEAHRSTASPSRPPDVDNNMTRIRATSYVTRTTPAGPQLLVFDYPAHPDAGIHLPGGGVEPGERPDTAAIREAFEETGITGPLELHGVVGVQQGTYNTGDPYISIYFHLTTTEIRDTWTHVMIGDEGVWDTGLDVTCRLIPLADAEPVLRTSWHRQDEFLHLLDQSPNGGSVAAGARNSS
jgi:8-oxo-dGTP pyrophosphatase MutT (NUDIX family)